MGRGDVLRSEWVCLLKGAGGEGLRYDGSVGGALRSMNFALYIQTIYL